MCGYALLKVYQRQFIKVLQMLMNRYIPLLEKISEQGQGSKSYLQRLKMLLEDVGRTGSFKLPQGLPNSLR